MPEETPLDPSLPPVTGADQAAARWFVRLRDPEATASDWAGFETWRAEPRNNAAYAELERLWRGARAAAPGRPRASRGALAPLALAAGVLLCLGWVWSPATFARLLPGSQITPVGIQRTMVLSDGTAVSLDAGSAIAVRYTPGARRVELLYGRAYFRVRHNAARPFEVAVGRARVDDVGTAFDVRRTPSGGDVAVAEGAVSLTTGDGRHSLLPAGAEATFANAPGPVTRCDPATVAAWRAGRLVFDNTALSDVLDELRRYRGGRFVVLDPALARRRVTGVFNTRDVDQAVTSILTLAHAHSSALGPITVIWTPARAGA